MRISLKDILGVFAFVAVILGCGARVGFDSDFYWMVVVLSSILTCGFVAIASRERARWLAIVWAVFPFLLCASPFGSAALLLNILLLVIAGVVFAFRRFRPKTVAIVAMTCMLVSFVAAVQAGNESVRHLTDLRREYPIVSLASRLEYERHSKTASTAESPIKLAAPVDVNLIEFESQFDDRSYRLWQLEQIHDRRYEVFIRSTGFGIARMDRPSSESLRIEPLREIDPTDADEERSGRGDWTWSEIESIGPPDELQKLHTVSRRDFFSLKSLGFVIQPVAQVVGFSEHGFRHVPTAKLEDRDSWTIERLELVSLLKHDQPRVYVLDHLPRMDQLSGNEVSTRALDDFENAALPRLQTNEDVITEEIDGKTRMLGSLRAASQCLECHNVQRGALLGAFTYVLRRGPAE